MATINEVGNRYGRLTVIGRAPADSGLCGAMWICRCDCGKTVQVLGIRLRSGNNRSCGCLKTMHPQDRISMGYMPYGRERKLRDNL